MINQNYSLCMLEELPLIVVIGMLVVGKINGVFTGSFTIILGLISYCPLLFMLIMQLFMEFLLIIVVVVVMAVVDCSIKFISSVFMSEIEDDL